MRSSQPGALLIVVVSHASKGAFGIINIGVYWEPGFLGAADPCLADMADSCQKDSFRQFFNLDPPRFSESGK